MKKQKGITLIALIITIIVMLILVGVTVTTAINGGLFEKARIAAKGTQKEVDREKLNMAVAFAYDETTGKIDRTKLQQELGEEWTVTESESGTYLCENTKTGNKFKVKANGKITDDEPLTINCKIVESTMEDKGEITTSKIMFFIPETGIDYEENFCKLSESDSIEAGWEAIWRSSLEEGDESEFSMAKVEQMMNESNGLEGENTLSIDEWTKWYALVYETQVKKSVSIKFNGTELIRDAEDSPAKELEGDEANMQLSEMTIKVRVGEKVWSNKPLEEIIKTIKPGDIFLQEDKSDSKKDTYYTVLYNDDSHGLQLIANKRYIYNPYPFYFGEYGHKLLTYMNNAAAEKVNISKYAEKTRNVGGPFEDPAYNGEYGWPADEYYLEDCNQMKKLKIMTMENEGSGASYILSSRIVIKDGENTIYGLRMVSAAGECGNNIYQEIPTHGWNGGGISINLQIRPVVKIAAKYYDSILLKSTDENGVKTYIFSE